MKFALVDAEKAVHPVATGARYGSHMSMTEESIDLRTADGVIDGIVFRVAEPRLSVLHLPDIGGIRPAHIDKARRLAERGYTVLLANCLYRSGKPPFFDFRLSGDERSMKRIAELSAPLTPEAVERDAAAYVGFLEGAVGVVGHCFSGQIALRIAAAQPERVVAAASFHGGWLVTDRTNSPHLVLPRVQARLYFGHATDDRSMPPAAIATLEQALVAWGGQWQSEVYEGARHGWTVSDNPVYNAPQAERAFEKLNQLLNP